MNNIKIRQATKDDATAILQLIQELAEFERAPHEVTNTVEQIIIDGFGPNPVFKAGVAESGGKIVGLYLWYIRYSTWKGKGLYLEDIIVNENYRNQGIGARLFEACVADAKAMDANFMIWQVLDWNVDAIRFYERYSPDFDDEWINVKLSKQQITDFKFSPRD